MKKAFLILAVLCACFNSFAQINFEPGYFIDNNGVKTECLIKNLAWKNNPVTFDYKMAAGAETKEAQLQDITAFEVSGYKFVRFTVKLERSLTSVSELTNEYKPIWKTETLYLRPIIEGSLNLYSYEDGNLIKYFVSTAPHTEARQLLHMNYLDDNLIKENNFFRQELYNLMKDKGYSSNTFEKLGYNKDALVALFLKYNGESNIKVTDRTLTQNKASFNLRIAPGISYAHFNVDTGTKNSGYFPYHYHDFKGAAVVRLGFEAECVLPFNNKKWSVFTDPNIQYYKKDETTKTQSNNTTIYHGWQAKYNFAEVPMGARYSMFLNSKNKFFVDAAYVLAVKLGDSYIQRDMSGKLTISNTSNFAVGAGYAFDGKYSAEIRYTFNRQTLNYMTWSGEYNSIGLIVAYKIL